MDVSDFRYELSGGVLRKVLKIDEGIVAVLRPRQTAIVQVEPIENGIVVREDYNGFKGSNVYLVDYDLREQWTAQLPAELDSYSGQVIRAADAIECTTWNGWKCRLSAGKGELIGKGFVK